MDIQDIGIVLTACISGVTFIYILIKDFLIQGKIRANFNSFLFLRVNLGNKVRLISYILQRDFRSEYKSDDAKEILRLNPHFRKDIEANNFIRIEQHISKSYENKKAIYKLPEKYILETIQFIDFGVNISIPISISNERKRSVFLTDIILKISSEKDIYFFNCSYILNEKALLERTEIQNDINRISGAFTGSWIKPNETLTAFYVFLLKIKEKDKLLTEKGVIPSVYDFTVTGIDEDGDVIFKVLKKGIKLEQGLFLNAFSGVDTSIKIQGDNIT